MGKTSHKRMILSVVLISYFLILLSNSVIFTGIVNIQKDLNLNQIVLSWLSNSYALTFGGLLLLAGKFGDIYSRKLIFMTGVGVFGIASLFAGYALNGTFMIIARAFQGIGAALIAPTSLALLLENFTGSERDRAIALYGATAGVGASVGLVLGGFFASVWTWRIGFLINFPISLGLIYLTARFVTQQRVERQHHIDWLGGVLSIAGMALLLYAVSNSSLVFFLLSIILLLLFIYHQNLIANPVMPLRLFQDKERVGAYLSRFVYMGAMMSFWFYMPQLLQNDLGLTPLWVGFGFFPLTIAMYLVSMQLPKITARLSNQRTAHAGIALTLVGLLGLSFYQHQLGYFIGIACPMLLIGGGQAMVLSPLTLSGVTRTFSQDAGAASSVVNTVHQLGGAVGLALVTLLTHQDLYQIFRFDHAMWWNTSMVFLALVISLFLIKPNTRI